MKYKGLIPVLTVDDEEYKQPTRNEGGLYVVNKNAVQGYDSNKFVFYHQGNGKYYHINAQTASPDYLQQIRDYEDRLAGLAATQANPMNSKQVNSLADIMSINMADRGKAWDAMWSGEGSVVDYLKSMFIPSERAVEAATTYFRDMVWGNIVNKDLSSGQKAATQIMNTLNNVGEVMDYMTGTTAVKALLQGKSIEDGYVWNDETGRNNYDWNTGSGIADFTLELISDPTNWISFGGKALIGNAIKSSVDDVAASMGLTANKKYLNKITRGMYESFGDDSMLRNVNVKTLFNLTDAATTDDVANIMSRLRTAMDAKAAYKNSLLINSVMGTSDALEKAAFKAATLTSTLGLEGWAVKAVSKGGHQLWLNSQLGKMLRMNKTNGEFKMADYVKVSEDVKKFDGVLKDLTRMYDDVQDDVVNSATINMQLSAVKEIHEIFRKFDSTEQVEEFIAALNKWAVDNGFANIAEAHTFLKSIYDNVDGSLREVVNLIEDAIRNIKNIYNARKISGQAALKEIIEKAKRELIKLDTDEAYEGAFDYTMFANTLKSNGNLTALYKSLEALKDVDDIVEPLREVLEAAIRNNIMEGVSYVVYRSYDVDYTAHQMNGLIGELHDLRRTAPILPTDAALLLDKAEEVFVNARNVGFTSGVNKQLEDLQAYLEEMHATRIIEDSWDNLITQYEKLLQVRIDEVAKDIVLNNRKTLGTAFYKAAPSKYGTTNPASKALKANLDKFFKNSPEGAPDTSRAFIHPNDAQLLNNEVITLSIDDLVSELGYSVWSIQELVDYLINSLSYHNLYEVTDDINFLRQLAEGATKNAFKLSIDDAEELARMCRRRSKELDTWRAGVADETMPGADTHSKIKTGTVKINKAYVDNVKSGYWTKEEFKKNMGYSYDSVRTTEDGTGYEVDTFATYAFPDIYETMAKQNQVRDAINEAAEDSVLFNNIAENIESFIQSIALAQFDEMLVDAEQLSSKLYAVKLSQAYSLSSLINTAAVKDMCEAILNNEGIGAVVKVLESVPETSVAAETLHALSVSVEVYTKVLDAFRKNGVISDQWAGALIDSLAGIMRLHWSEVKLDNLTDLLLTRAKTFINKSSNNMSNVSQYVDRVYLPYRVTDRLKMYLSNPALTDKNTDIRDMYDAFRRYLDKTPSYDIVYSIGQRSKETGMFEFVCELPDEIPGYGRHVHFVDDTVDAAEMLKDPRYAEEMFGLHNGVNVKSYAPNAVHFKSTDAFARAMHDFLETLKAHVNPFDSDTHTDIRFIGWGNSADYTRQDSVFNEFLSLNKISFRIDDSFSSSYTAKSVDFKAFMHSESGAAVVSDELRDAVKNILAESKQTLDMWNAKFQSSKAYIMPDVSKDVLASIDTITAFVEQALLGNKQIPEVFSNYSKNVLIDMHGALRSFSEDLSTSLRNIRRSNRYMARELIVSKLLSDYSGERNIMHFLQNWMVDGFHEGVSNIALKTYHDPALVASWFDMKSSLFENIHVGDLLKINKMLSQFQSTVDNIRNIGLLYDDSSLRGAEVVVNTLHNILKQHTTSKTVRHNINFIEQMKAGLTPEQTFAVAVYYAKEINRIPGKKSEIIIDGLLKGWEKNDSDALSYFGFVRHPEESILSKDGMYSLDIPTSRFDDGIDESYLIHDALEAVKEVDRVRAISDCLEDSMALEDAALSKYHSNDSTFRLKYRMLKAFNKFVEVISTNINGHKAYYHSKMAEATGAVERHSVKKMYSQAIELVKEQLDELGAYHAEFRVKNIFGMSLEDYEKYLYKYSQGIQLFDVRAKVFKSEHMSTALLDFMNRVRSTDNKTSIRVANIPNSHYVAVYVDKDLMSARMKNKDFKESFKGLRMHFELDDIPEDSSIRNNLFLNEYRDLVKETEHTYNVAYSMSMHRAMNDKVFDELWAYLPEDLKVKLYSKEHWAEMNYLQNGLNHTMVGDYNSGLGDVFTTYSGNILSNVVSGVSKLYKQSVSREAYVTFFTSPINSLKTRVDIVRELSGEALSPAEVSAALESQGYKAVSFDGKELRVWDTSTTKGLNDAYSHNAVVMDNDVYDKVYRTIVDNTLPEKLIKNPVFSYLLLLKLGQLQSPGWVMRNIIDSTVKGMVATGGGTEYVRMIPETVRKLKEFDKILEAVYKEYEGTSAYKIRKFYMNKSELASKYSLSLEEVLDYYKFSKDSASVPTAAQLSILNKVEERLTKSLGSTYAKALLKAFIDNDGNKVLTREALEKIYSSDIVNLLMSKINEIPKGYAKMRSTNLLSKAATYLTEHSPLMHWNNSVERISRFLVYDYTRQTGATTGKAIAAVNASQFNRAYDSVGRRVLETLFPFSSFQVDNMMFWINALASSKGSVVGVLSDYLQTRYDEEEITPEEIALNASAQYMFLEGNILLDNDNDLVLKVSDSLSSTMQILADPMSLKDSLLVPAEKLIEFIKACMQDEEEYDANPYGKVKPISKWDGMDWFNYGAELTPLFGAWWLRQQTAWTEEATPLTTFFRRIAPSVFGKVKRTGYDWYNQTEEYRKSHTFVPGISYVPQWLLKDPLTYANTKQRLINMGYDEELATKMVSEWGYYMKAPDYILKKYTPSVPKPRTAYVPYAKKYYPSRKVARAPRVRKAYTKKFNLIGGSDRYRTTRFGTARIYRLTSMYDRITKTGTSRMTMMLSRGHGASSIRIVRDRIKNNTIRRQRQRRMLHM